MFSWMYSFIDRLFVVVGALLFMQIPQYFQQYTALLSGHLSELAYQVDLMDRSARLGGKNLSELIQKFLKSTDPDFSAQGALMRSTLERFHTFKEASSSLQEASLLERPFLLIKYFNWQICQETFNQFHFGLPLNLEGLTYALLGMIAGYFLFWGLKQAFYLVKRKEPLVKKGS